VSQSNKIVRDLLRLVTPDEISELTKIAGAKPKVPLTQLVEKELQSLREYNLNRMDGGDASSSEGSGGPKSKDRNNINLEREEKKGLRFLDGEGDEPLRGSLFILSQKEKLRSSVSKIKEKEVLELYKDNSAVDLNQEKQNRKREDRTLSSHTGVLVNKRQY
tara:strand:- start:144 stop:629 length:486 start_codon:yes stop_codon:yes gene_type:complete